MTVCTAYLVVSVETCESLLAGLLVHVDANLRLERLEEPV